jgi:ribonucleoside-diphosphate reductase subunit M2
MMNDLIKQSGYSDSEKDKMFNAIANFPCIEQKAKWAIKWINDKRSSFASRLIAFA